MQIINRLSYALQALVSDSSVMPELIYALFELLFVSIDRRGKTVGEAREEFKELFKDAPRRDKFLLLIVIFCLVAIPALIITFIIARN